MSPVSASVVMEFQEKIWSGSILDTSDDIAEFLFDLAYELDYYEPDPTSRKEINSLFGEDELHRRVKEAIEKLSIFLSYA